MRARYYHPEIKRFINADIVAGNVSDAVTLNRFAYANCNPVSFVDPFGLSPERGYTVDYTNDINGIGLLNDGTIIAGNNVTSDDILTLIVISEMTKSGHSKQEILEFVNTYVDSKKKDTVIKKDKLLEYYTAFDDVTKPLTELMLKVEYEYTMVNNNLSYADIPLYWTTKLMEFKLNAGNEGIWDLKQLPEWQQSSLYYFNGELVDSDAPGNIMYGYIGKSYGIPNNVLYLGAGIAQIVAGTTKAQWIYSGTGDDPIDYKNIVQGIDYYDEFH